MKAIVWILAKYLAAVLLGIIEAIFVFGMLFGLFGSGYFYLALLIAAAAFGLLLGRGWKERLGLFAVNFLSGAISPFFFIIWAFLRVVD